MLFSARSVLVVIGVGGVLGFWLRAPHAAAYCQTTSSEEQASSCSSDCVKGGFPLAWPKSNLTYVFNQAGFPGLSDSEQRKIFADAFGAWTGVDCDGEPVGLKLTAAQRTTTLTVGPKSAEPNDNVIAHLTVKEWAEHRLDPHAFALTAIWFDTLSGRILGADMHFNGGMDPFGVCPKDGCGPSVRLTDLPNVATHEAGHFLGLAHSQDQDSTMWCDAQGSETNKRSLEPDDEDGLCHAYPAGLAFTDAYFPPRPPSRRSSSGCAATPGGSSLTTGLIPVLLGFGLWIRRRRG